MYIIELQFTIEIKSIPFRESQNMHYYMHFFVIKYAQNLMYVKICISSMGAMNAVFLAEYIVILFFPE